MVIDRTNQVLKLSFSYLEHRICFVVDADQSACTCRLDTGFLHNRDDSDLFSECINRALCTSLDHRSMIVVSKIECTKE